MLTKKILTAIIAGLLISGQTLAENSLRTGAKAINLTVNTTGDSVLFSEALDTRLKGKYFTSNDMAILFGVGLNLYGSDADATDLSLMGGVRSYMSRGDFATFYGGSFTFADLESIGVEETVIMGEFGGEYFLGRQFSVEGSLRAGYAKTDVGAFSQSNIGTFGGQVSLNYYF